MRYIYPGEAEERNIHVQHKDGTWGRVLQCLDGRHNHVEVQINASTALVDVWHIDDVVARSLRKS